MKKYISFESADGRTDLNVVMWLPNGRPRAAVQIIHGMAEFIERYDAFARFLNEHQIMVIGHDHLGHGDSVDAEHPLYGYFSKGNSPDILTSDTANVTAYLKKRFPTLPLFLLGHSMGSFILRNYLQTQTHPVDGAIVMGTSSERREAAHALRILRVLNRTSGTKFNPVMDKLIFLNYNQPFKQDNLTFSWLSKNQENVRWYEANDKTGFPFTNNGYYTLMSLIHHGAGKKWYESISRTLPFLIISGEMDPVGNYGKGPRKVAQELQEGHFDDVTLQLYHDLRHEILHEAEADIVMLDLLNWMQKRMD